MSTAEKPRMGRPPGQEFPHLLHVRISDDMRDELDRIRDSRLDSPSMTALVREALAQFVKAERRRDRAA